MPLSSCWSRRLHRELWGGTGIKRGPSVPSTAPPGTPTHQRQCVAHLVCHGGGPAAVGALWGGRALPALGLRLLQPLPSAAGSYEEGGSVSPPR